MRRAEGTSQWNYLVMLGRAGTPASATSGSSSQEGRPGPWGGSADNAAQGGLWGIGDGEGGPGVGEVSRAKVTQQRRSSRATAPPSLVACAWFSTYLQGALPSPYGLWVQLQRLLKAPRAQSSLTSATWPPWEQSKGYEGIVT